MSSPLATLQSLRQLVQEDELERAVGGLVSFARGLPRDARTSHLERAIHLSARLTRQRRDLADGLVAREQAQVERNQLRLALLGSLEDLACDAGSLPAPPDAAASAGEPAIDFAILTAIEVERRAVCAALGLSEEHRVRRGARVYWRGHLALAEGASYEIVVAQSTDMANVDAALLTSDVLQHWRPGSALLVGIAATAREDVRLGDVVIGSHVYYHERGKVTPGGTRPEVKMIPADAKLWNSAAAVPDWPAGPPIARPDGAADPPRIHRGVIASGEKVIADAAVREQIAAGHRKILAVEMEGYGFSRAIGQSGEPVRHLVIRGICDDGSAAKDDRWHAYAAAAAAGFAVHFLRDRPVEPRR